ncbi:MAG: GTA-gp10 family protein [Rickettsiales bacterium]
MTPLLFADTPIRINEHTYRLRPTIGALCNIEAQTESSIVTLITDLHESQLPCDTLRLILSEGAKAANTPLKTAKLSKKILKNTLPQLCTLLLQGIGCAEASVPLNAQILKLLHQPDWQDMFKIYVGMMGYSTQEFQQITLAEYLLAVEGFAQFHDIDISTATPATSQDLAEMLQKFPDEQKG